MAIRSAAKALLIKDGKILLNRCRRDDGTVYYDLPGGGQHQGECLEDAVLREIREETGCEAKIIRFAALAEEIYTDPELCAKYPDYCHRMMHIFIAEPLSWGDPTEMDHQMEGFEWISLEDIGSIELLPHKLKDQLPRILAGETLWVGSEIIP